MTMFDTDKIIRVWIGPGLIQEAPTLATIMPNITKKELIEELSKIEDDQTILDYFKVKFMEASNVN